MKYAETGKFTREQLDKMNQVQALLKEVRESGLAVVTDNHDNLVAYRKEEFVKRWQIGTERDHQQRILIGNGFGKVDASYLPHDIFFREGALED